MLIQQYLGLIRHRERPIEIIDICVEIAQPGITQHELLWRDGRACLAQLEAPGEQGFGLIIIVHEPKLIAHSEADRRFCLGCPRKSIRYLAGRRSHRVEKRDIGIAAVIRVAGTKQVLGDEEGREFLCVLLLLGDLPLTVGDPQGVGDEDNRDGHNEHDGRDGTHEYRIAL